jgi:hypothetical protein
MEALVEKHKRLEAESILAQKQKEEEVKKANDEVQEILAKNKEQRADRLQK